MDLAQHLATAGIVRRAVVVKRLRVGARVPGVDGLEVAAADARDTPEMSIDPLDFIQVAIETGDAAVFDVNFGRSFAVSSSPSAREKLTLSVRM